MWKVKNIITAVGSAGLVFLTWADKPVDAKNIITEDIEDTKKQVLKQTQNSGEQIKGEVEKLNFQSSVRKLPADIQEHLVSVWEENRKLVEQGLINSDNVLTVDTLNLSRVGDRLNFLAPGGELLPEKQFEEFTPNGETQLTGQIVFDVMEKLFDTSDIDVWLRSPAGEELSDKEKERYIKNLKIDYKFLSEDLINGGEWDKLIVKGYLSSNVFGDLINHFNQGLLRLDLHSRETLRRLWLTSLQMAYFENLSRSESIKTNTPRTMKQLAERVALLNIPVEITRITHGQATDHFEYNYLFQEDINKYFPHANYSNLLKGCFRDLQNGNSLLFSSEKSSMELQKAKFELTKTKLLISYQKKCIKLTKALINNIDKYIQGDKEIKPKIDDDLKNILGLEKNLKTLRVELVNIQVEKDYIVGLDELLTGISAVEEDYIKYVEK